MFDPGENNDHHLSKNRLGTDLIGAIQAAQIHIVAGPDDVHEAIAPNLDAGGADGGKEKPEHSELDGLVAKRSALAGGINKAENEGCSSGIIGGGGDLAAADETEIEEPGCAVECGLHDLGGPRVDGQNEGLEDEMGVVGGRNAVERGAGSGIGIRGGIGEGFELVESGFASGNQLGVFSPGDVLDDLVQGGAQQPATAGGTAQGGLRLLYR